MRTPDFKTFMQYYSQWEADCRKELSEKGYTDTDNVQLNEDGSVFFGNLSQTGVAFVTPWKNSVHYVQ